MPNVLLQTDTDMYFYRRQILRKLYINLADCVPLSALKILEDRNNNTNLMDYAASILQAIIHDNMKVRNSCTVHSYSTVFLYFSLVFPTHVTA